MHLEEGVERAHERAVVLLAEGEAAGSHRRDGSVLQEVAVHVERPGGRDAAARVVLEGDVAALVTWLGFGVRGSGFGGFGVGGWGLGGRGRAVPKSEKNSTARMA